MKWKESKNQYMSGEDCFLGKWKVGGIHYNGLVSVSDPKKYAATCLLPGIKDHIGHYVSADEAKTQVEEAVKHWFREIPSVQFVHKVP